jgi:hypothetical protein
MLTPYSKDALLYLHTHVHINISWSSGMNLHMPTYITYLHKSTYTIDNHQAHSCSTSTQRASTCRHSCLPTAWVHGHACWSVCHGIKIAIKETEIIENPRFLHIIDFIHRSVQSVRMYVCMCIYIYICKNMHTHTHIFCVHHRFMHIYAHSFTLKRL